MWANLQLQWHLYYLSYYSNNYFELLHGTSHFICSGKQKNKQTNKKLREPNRNVSLHPWDLNFTWFSKWILLFNKQGSTKWNIFSYYTPNKLITVDDKDPTRMNESIKKKILVKKYINLLIPTINPKLW